MPNDTQAQKPLSKLTVFRNDLDRVIGDMRSLPNFSDTKGNELRNAAIIAVTKDPEILTADRASLMMAFRACAQYGVHPDGVEATIQVHKTRVKQNGQDVYIKKATLMPMVRGIIKRILKSGRIKLVYAEVVCDGETFKLDLSQGDRRPIHDFDPFDRDLTKIKGSYAVVTYENGTIDCEPVPRSELDKIRKVAKTQNVWDNWFSEKSKVAAIKRLAKRLDLAADDLSFVMNRDETDFADEQNVSGVKPAKSGFTAAMEAHRPVTKTSEQPAATSEPEDAQLIDAHWTDSFNQTGAPSDEWDEGVKAAQDGQPITNCPYQNDKEKAADWLTGYRKTKKANG